MEELYTEPHITQIPLTTFIRSSAMQELSLDQIEQMLAWAERTLEKIPHEDDKKQMKKDISLLREIMRKLKRAA